MAASSQCTGAAQGARLFASLHRREANNYLAYRHTSVHSQIASKASTATRIAIAADRERCRTCAGPRGSPPLVLQVGEAAHDEYGCGESPATRNRKPDASAAQSPRAAASAAPRESRRAKHSDTPISDEELRRRTLVASGRYDELARLLQSVKLRKLLVSLSKAGVEDATLDSVGLETLNEFDISAKNPGEGSSCWRRCGRGWPTKGSDGRKRGTVITACKGYCFVRADGQPKKKGKDGYYCSFKDVEGRKSLVKGDRVAFEVVACAPGSKHSFKLQNVVVVSDDGTLLGRLGLGHLAPVLAREQIDEETLPLLSVEDLVEAGISKNEAKLIVATAAAPPSPPKKPNGEHERTLAEAKGAVLRLMEENKRLREESSAGLSALGEGEPAPPAGAGRLGEV